MRDYPFQELRFDLIGVDSILGTRLSRHAGEPAEVRLRAAARAAALRDASMIAREVEALYTNGPAGGGGVTGSTRETIGLVSTLIARDMIVPRMYYQES